MKKTLSLGLLMAMVLMLALAAGPVFGGNHGEGDGSDRGLERAKDAARKHTKALFQDPLVVGVGVGRTAGGQGAVVVLTKAAGAGVPGTLDGVPVVVRVTGLIVPLHHVCGHVGGPPGSDPSPPCATGAITGVVTDSSTSLIIQGASVSADTGQSDTTDDELGSYTLNDVPTGDRTVAASATGFVSQQIQTNVTEGGTSIVDFALDPEPAGGGGNNCFVTGDTTARCDRPVPIGVSTGHPSITAGTIGARVTDGTDVWALSNNHVYAATNSAAIGDAVIQPGTFDGGTLGADDLGTLFRFKTIVFAPAACTGAASDPDCNVMDAAIASSSTTNLGNATPSDGYGIPALTTLEATFGMLVQKYGRTTLLTTGTVSATDMTIDVCYKAKGPFRCDRNFIARFVDQDFVEGGSFSAGGDSGSLVVTQGRNPVGLLFAGTSNSTIFSPIDAILAEFGVTIDDTP